MATYFTVNGLVYCNYKEGEVILVATEGMKRPVRNIPAEVENDGQKFKVTAISDRYIKDEPYTESWSGSQRNRYYGWMQGVFFNDDILSDVSFPETLSKFIQEKAAEKFSLPPCSYENDSKGTFRGCKNLKRVVFSNSLTNIGLHSFENCISLDNLFFGDNLEEIEGYAFRLCTGLKTVDFNDKLIKIGEHAFSGCESLKNVSFPDSLKDICGGAFEGCSSMTEVNIPPSVENIKYEAFANSGVKVVNIYSENVNVAEDAFPADAVVNWLDKNSAPKHLRRRRQDNSSKEIRLKSAEPEKVETPKIEEKEIPTEEHLGLFKRLLKKTANNSVPEESQASKITPSEPTPENVTNLEESGFILKIDTTVDALSNEFKNRFGSVLRIYEGRSKADGNKTLGAVGLSSEGTFLCRGSLTVGSFIQRMSDEFGLKVKVYTCDEWVAVLDGLTLTQSGKVKKNAVKADMENMIAYQRETKPSDEFSVVKNPDGSYTVSINGEVQSNAKGAMRQIAGAIGFEYDPSWTTQQFGSKLSKALKESTATAIAESR